MGRFLFNNIGYKLLAVMVAFVLWAAVQGTESVKRSLDLPVDFVNVPQSFVVVEQSAFKVNLQISGSRAAVETAERELTSYPISLSGLTQGGEAFFPVIQAHPNLPRGATIEARSPSTVVIQTEPVVRKKVPVSADLVGEIPEGFRLAQASVSPGQVIMAGARTSIRRLREVTTERVDLAEVTEDSEREVSLVAHGSLVWRAEEDDKPVILTLDVEPVELELDPGEAAVEPNSVGGE